MCRFVKSKEFVLRLLLNIFKRAVVFLYYNDVEFKRALLEANVRCFSMGILKTELSVKVVLDGGGVTVDSTNGSCEIEMVFKELCTAFKTFAGLISIEEAFAQKGIILKGSIAKALALTGAIKRLQALVFPDFWIRRAFKDFKKTGVKGKLTFYRFYLYCITSFGR